VTHTVPTGPRLGLQLTRRALLGGIAASTVTRLLPQSVAAEPVWSVYATTVYDRSVTLRSMASYSKGKDTGVVAPGSPVQVLAGPDSDGWYEVEWHGPKTAKGWLPADRLIFAQTARVMWDAGVFSGPADWNPWLGWLRHGLVVTLIGAPTEGYVLVRSGGLVGWTYLSALETSMDVETDPAGEQWIDANRSTLQVRLMIGMTAVDTFACRMSSETGDGFKSTAVGSWRIYEKVEGLQYTPYAKAYFMYWAGFDPGRFNGFHSWTMDSAGNVISTGNTWGCIATSPADAAKIYAFSWLGMRTEIHW
jgi:hypothetical protein